MARFYTTIKVHKDTYKFRTIVSTCGTALVSLSSWLDYKLRQLKPFTSMFTKDINDFPVNVKNFLKLKILDGYQKVQDYSRWMLPKQQLSLCVGIFLSMGTVLSSNSLKLRWVHQ